MFKKVNKYANDSPNTTQISSLKNVFMVYFETN